MVSIVSIRRDAKQGSDAAKIIQSAAYAPGLT